MAFTLKFKKLSERAELPKYAHPFEDACFDLKVLVDDGNNTPFLFNNGEKCPVLDSNRYEDAEGMTTGIYLRPGDSVVFHTGLACELPPTFVMKIYARSSTGIKKHLMLSNGVGIIDQGYHGEINIGLTNFGRESVLVRDGDRIAQAEICEVLPFEIVETDTLTDTARGTGGIGSTGAL